MCVYLNGIRDYGKETARRERKHEEITLSSTNMTNVELWHSFPLMQPAITQRLHDYMSERDCFREEDLVLARLPHQLPGYNKFLYWTELSPMMFITTILFKLAFTPWFEIFILLEMLYY